MTESNEKKAAAKKKKKRIIILSVVTVLLGAYIVAFFTLPKSKKEKTVTVAEKKIEAKNEQRVAVIDKGGKIIDEFTALKKQELKKAEEKIRTQLQIAKSQPAKTQTMPVMPQEIKALIARNLRLEAENQALKSKQTEPATNQNLTTQEIQKYVQTASEKHAETYPEPEEEYYEEFYQERVRPVIITPFATLGLIIPTFYSPYYCVDWWSYYYWQCRWRFLWSPWIYACYYPAHYPNRPYGNYPMCGNPSSNYTSTGSRISISKSSLQSSQHSSRNPYLSSSLKTARTTIRTYPSRFSVTATPQKSSKIINRRSPIHSSKMITSPRKYQIISHSSAPSRISAGRTSSGPKSRTSPSPTRSFQTTPTTKSTSARALSSGRKKK